MIKIKDEGKYDLIKKTVNTVLDFDCSHYSDSFILRRLEVRLRATNIDSYTEYSNILKRPKAPSILLAL